MKKIASIVLNNFVNDARVYKEALTLTAEGHEVTVVCLHDDGLPFNEIKDGIIINRINLSSRALPKNVFGWGIKYLEFFTKAVDRYFNYDIIHCHDLNTLSIGAFIKLFRGGKVRFVYDAHEFETEQQANPGVIMYSLTLWFEKILIRLCDAVITVSKPIAEAYAERYHIAEPLLILNCPPYQPEKESNILRERLNISKETRILLYQGGLLYERGIESLLQAFKSIDDNSLALVFMGYGPLESYVREYARNHERIYMIPAVSQLELLSYTASADFGLLFYENSCLNNYYCMPNKLFEYLMARVPVVVSPLHELKRLVEFYHLGVVSGDSSPENIKTALLEVLNFDRNLFKINVEEFNEEYNWEKQAAKLIHLYQGLCAE